MAAYSATYRAIWRWHFYAGLIVAPFLVILSVTGAIYLFNDELNDLLMPEMQFVAPVATPILPSRMIDAALATHPGAATQINLPNAPDRPAQVRVRPTTGDPLQVMVDPGSGRVLGSFVYTHTLVGFADVMHGSLTLGRWGDAVVELAACWALVLVATGLCLWWPRERWSMAGILWPRLRGKGRMFWRDVHVVTGVWTVGLIGFLLLTGLPWAVVQGPLVRAAVERLGIGNLVDAADYRMPSSQPMGEVLGRIGWAQETAPMPASDPAHAGHMSETPAASVDRAAVAGADAVAMKVAQAGIVGGYRLYLPSSSTGVYTALTFPGRPEEQRTLHFDRWSGALIGENAWARYGVGAKAIELGVQIHMGRYFGLANQLLMLVPCIAIIVLVASGIMMWWQRRPTGRLAPPPVSDKRIRGAVTILILAGIAMPLLGASLVVVFLTDRVVVATKYLVERPAWLS